MNWEPCFCLVLRDLLQMPLQSWKFTLFFSPLIMIAFPFKGINQEPSYLYRSKKFTFCSLNQSSATQHFSSLSLCEDSYLGDESWYRPVSTDSHFIDEETEAERIGAIACFKIQGIREGHKTPHP